MTEYPVVNAVIFASTGIVVFAVAFWILSKLAPFQLWHELAREHNVAVAVFAGAVALGLCWIIAATMH